MIYCEKCGAELLVCNGLQPFVKPEIHIINNLVHTPLGVDRERIVLCRDCFIKLERSIK